MKEQSLAFLKLNKVTMLRAAFYLAFLLPMTLQCAMLPAFGQEKALLTWPYFNLPPQFIVSTNDLQGMGKDVAALIQRELPEFEHRFVYASPHRIDEELRIGVNGIMAPGMLKTPEREKYVTYSSIPCRLTFSMMIVMRQEDRTRLTKQDAVSLAALFQNRNLTFGYIPGIKYGSFSPLVESYVATTKRRMYAAHNVGQLLEMLLRGRIDWFVHDTLGIWHEAEEQGATKRIALVESKEYPPTPISGYIVCAKTPWGEAVIKKIDKVLIGLVESGELFTTLQAWIPAPLLPEFSTAYNERILKAAKAARQAEN